MPRGPKGERRPADVIGNTVHVMRIATGQITAHSTRDFRARHTGHRGEVSYVVPRSKDIDLK
jgi:hypothetical protein